MKDVYLPCPCCCEHIHMTHDEWFNGGVFTCKKCGWKIRVPKHHKIPVKKQVSPLKEIKKLNPPSTTK